MTDGTVRWGILSSAKIARIALIPAFAAAGNARLVALGTPHQERVAESAREYGYRVLPDYQAVLDDPEVDAVYNPLPNGLHAEWSIRALRAGKHVLCEKPLTVDPSEIPPMIRASEESGRALMEAFMYRFHPQIEQAYQLLRSGRIGDLRFLRASFTFNSPPDPSNPRFQPGQGPGALLDVGCYCVNAARLFSGGPPTAVTAWSTWHEPSGGDLTTTGLLEFPTHSALFDCSFESHARSQVELVGSRGSILLTRPWLPGAEPAPIQVADESGSETLAAPAANHYVLMVEHFCRAVLAGEKPRPGPEDALENMRVLAALRRSALERRRVELTDAV